MQETKFFNIKLEKVKLIIILLFSLFLVLSISSCESPSINITSWNLNQIRDGRTTLYDVNNDKVMDLVITGYQKGGVVDLKKVLFIESGAYKYESSNGKWDERGYSFYLDKENNLWAKVGSKKWRVDKNYFKSNIKATISENGNLDIEVNDERVVVKNNRWERDSVLKIWLDEYDRMWVEEGDKKQIIANRRWLRKFGVLVNPISEWIKGSGYKRGGKTDKDGVPIGDCIVAIDGKTQKILWTFQAGDSIETYPSAYEGLIYFGSKDKTFYALYAKTGKPKWTYTTNAPIYSSPAVGKDMVYFGNRDGILYALDNRYGSLIWSFKTRLGIDSSPALYDKKVFFGSWDKNFYALDSDSGKVLWKRTFESYVGQTSPIIFDDAIYFGIWNGKVYSLDAYTGKTIWSFQTDDWIDKASPSVGKRGLIYIGNKRGNVYAINAYTGYLKWMFSAGDAITSAPVVAKDRVYVASRDGFLYAINPKNGKLVWERNTRFKIYTSPTLNVDEVYLSSRGGYVWSIRDTGMGNPEWSMFGGSPTNRRTAGNAFNFSKTLVRSKAGFGIFFKEFNEFFRIKYEL